MNKLKKIQWMDILAIGIFIVIFPMSLLYKRKRKNLWLIMESGYEARDNGYWLFKYIKENHPTYDVVFVISEDSPDLQKVEELGPVVEHRSFKHWLYYLSAQVNISTQKAGNPNAAVFYILETVFNLSKNRVFLQHGITMSNATWLYYNNTKFKRFICGAKPEYEYVKQNFGYPENSVKYIGFCRFDSLIDSSKRNKQIVIMPSWRNWLVNHPDQEVVTSAEVRNFEDSTFYRKWREFLTNKNFVDYCENENIPIIFFPHRNMQPFLHLFEDIPYVKMYSWKDYDIQDLLRNSSLLITDYSSVSLDFSYMNKPVVYYQFDIEEFRSRQYDVGYFDYSRDGFGPLIENQENIYSIVKDLNLTNFRNPEIYEAKVNDFFKLKDNSNCKRTVTEILNLIQGE